VAKEAKTRAVSLNKGLEDFCGLNVLSLKALQEKIIVIPSQPFESPVIGSAVPGHFEKKLTKEEKKKLAAERKAARKAKKAAKADADACELSMLSLDAMKTLKEEVDYTVPPT